MAYGIVECGERGLAYSYARSRSRPEYDGDDQGGCEQTARTRK